MRFTSRSRVARRGPAGRCLPRASRIGGPAGLASAGGRAHQWRPARGPAGEGSPAAGRPQPAAVPCCASGARGRLRRAGRRAGPLLAGAGRAPPVGRRGRPHRPVPTATPSPPSPVRCGWRRPRGRSWPARPPRRSTRCCPTARSPARADGGTTAASSTARAACSTGCPVPVRAATASSIDVPRDRSDRGVAFPMPQCQGSRCKSGMVLATVTGERTPTTPLVHLAERGTTGKVGASVDPGVRRPAAARTTSFHEAWKKGSPSS
jgi:hypothetical protein